MATPVREVDVEVLPKDLPPPPPPGPGPYGAQPGARVDDPLVALIARIMDSIFQVPGTKIKVGLDPIIGLIPGFGSGASALISLLLIARSATQGVPNVVLARMVGNVIVNAVLDAVPVVGDALSVFYRSNDRNYELLLRYAGTRKKWTLGDWLVLTAIFLGAFGVIFLVFIGILTIASHTLKALSGH
jgi:hypothetical protein